MSTQFANTLNNHPIYADRAEKDAAGNTIATTYQEKLTAGTGITIDSSNVISATGGGGGSTYTAGNGIDISSDVISVQVTSPNAGDIVTLDCDGHLVDSGVAPSDLQPKLTAGANITIDANNVISASGGGGGTSYTAGNGISITGTTISAKTSSPIWIDSSGNIGLDGKAVPLGGTDGQVLTKVNGSVAWANAPGGGGGAGLTAGSAVIDYYQDQQFFTIDGLSFDYKYDTTGGAATTYISVSSSTVSTVYIDKKWLKYQIATAGGYNQPGYVYQGLMPTSGAITYNGVSLSNPIHLIDITTNGGTPDLSESVAYPTSFDFRIYYEVNNTTKVIYLNMFIWGDGQGNYDIRYSYTIG